MAIPLIDLKSQYNAIKHEVRSSIDRVLDSACYIKGEEVNCFEKEFASFCGAKHCVGVASGTAALHLALLACGVQPGDEVITVPYTFVATVEAVSYVGAKPVFVDIEPITYAMDVNKLEQAITKRTKAIIPVHLYGHPANMNKLIEVAKKYKLKVIEDAAQAHGAMIAGKKVGTFGDVGCFSFYPAKNLGAYGDGGAIVTNDDYIDNQIRLLSDHGRTDKYSHLVQGFNYRLDAIQAAILRVKLKYLQEWTEQRRKKANRYNELLFDLPIILPKEENGYYHVYHLYVIRTPKRDALRDFLSKESIDSGIHYPIPLHLQEACKHLGYKSGDFPKSEECAKEVISLPLYPELKEGEQNKIANVIKNVLAKLTEKAVV